VEDDHVDRPGVEERQRLKLTGTNSSIGLIVLIAHAHRKRDDLSALKAVPPGRLRAGTNRLLKRAFRRPGGHGGAAAPDPIPNSAVKRSSADGTSSQDAGE
jgi:hypothetical protein